MSHVHGGVQPFDGGSREGNQLPLFRMRVLRRIVLAVLPVLSLSGLVFSLGAHPAGAATRGRRSSLQQPRAMRLSPSPPPQAGVPYCDGGGGINGPSNGGFVETGCGAGVAGFDCMSLAQYAVYQVTGIVLPSDGSQLSGVGTVIPASDTADLQPGDVTFWGGTLDHFTHSGVYAGNDEVWDAVGPGIPVQLHTLTYLEGIYTYDGAIRYCDGVDHSDPYSHATTDTGWPDRTGGRHGRHAERDRVLVDQRRR